MKRFAIVNIDVADARAMQEVEFRVPKNAKRITGVLINLQQVADTANSLRTTRRYWGVAATGTLNSAFVNALTNHEMIESKVKTFAVTAGANEFIWYAQPVRLSIPNISMDGVSGGFQSPVTVSVTAPSTNGFFTEDYYVFQSNAHSLGAKNISIE